MTTVIPHITKEFLNGIVKIILSAKGKYPLILTGIFEEFPNIPSEVQENLTEVFDVILKLPNTTTASSLLKSPPPLLTLTGGKRKSTRKKGRKIKKGGAIDMGLMFIIMIVVVCAGIILTGNLPDNKKKLYGDMGPAAFPTFND